jgi:hypothetical protein
MSTLVAQTLSNGTVSTSTANCIQGSAKAWVNFDGTTGTVRGSYNVSSVTRVGTGDYNVNFTNAFANTNYCACYGMEVSTITGGLNNQIVGYPAGRLTTQFRLATGYNQAGSQAQVDEVAIYASFFS